ncbi:peptidyl-prolyl cis-trans isomerase D [Escherichia coli]|nr:peptidyl-prolyl cis-trans isomerase D [Escherichia coli]
MMDSLRTAANSLVLKIIFGIIIVSFILTGVSGYLIGGGNNYAAKVNDQESAVGNSRTPSTASVIACSNSWAINTPSWQRTKAI